MVPPNKREQSSAKVLNYIELIRNSPGAEKGV